MLNGGEASTGARKADITTTKGRLVWWANRAQKENLTKNEDDTKEITAKYTRVRARKLLLEK